MPAWVNDRNAALLTDLYQLTMCQAYWREDMDAEAVFDCFIRRMPGRNFYLACGLEDVLHFLETAHFTEENIAYLETLDLFEPQFLEHLASWRFRGEVWALPEGTPFFPDEPILEVVAPIMESQLVETFILNQITFQTAVATKANRIVRAARGRTVVDFGARRMHGTDATMKAARAAYVGGAAATSNVLAGKQYKLSVTGTMAHSYVETHADEMDAFRAFSELYPETTLLVDTYDTLEGVRKVVALAEERGDDFRVQALRLDSGDLAVLAKEARHMLDEAGLEEVQLFASSSLDEFRIRDLLDEGAPIDGFGVGTRLGTVSDHPDLDSAYKLCGYAGEGRMKLSSEKSNYPGKKQVVRRFDDGSAQEDLIALREEELDGEPLMRCVMREGERTDAGREELDTIRERVEREVDRLPDRLLDLEKQDEPYPVRPSDRLDETTKELRRKLVQQHGVEA